MKEAHFLIEWSSYLAFNAKVPSSTPDFAHGRGRVKSAQVPPTPYVYYPPVWSAFEPHHSRCEFEGFATGSACISLSGSLDGLRTRARSPTRALELPGVPPTRTLLGESVHAEPVGVVVAEPVERA